MRTKTPDSPAKQRGAITTAVAVAALGYFVDIYDLILFGFIRQESLTDIGYSGDALTTKGEILIQVQMAGLLVGGILWGVLGDRKGRLSVLFGSILLYSIANIANAFVYNLESYVAMRFIAGVGLAGELGAGITLVSELVSKEKRGIATTIVAAFGLLGAVAAGFITLIDWGMDMANWRIAYLLGGAMGLALLMLRIGVFESGMFAAVRSAEVKRGHFLSLFTNPQRFGRYIRTILIGVPVWYVVGILVFFLPEFLKYKHLEHLVPDDMRKSLAKYAIGVCYAGIAIGDLCSGLLSQFLGSRRRALTAFMLLSVAVVAYYLFVPFTSFSEILAVCFMLGFATGYWAVFVTVASEQFGTNLRATVTTTVPNFVRGSVSLVLLLFAMLRDDDGLGLGMLNSAIIVGLLVFSVAFFALSKLPETFGKDLDYLED